MRVPINWLKEYVEFDATPEELADKLTFSGLEVEQIESLGAEYVLEIEVTPNRPDCLSIIGVAREVAALYESQLKWPDADFKEGSERVEALTSVELLDPAGCPRYTARVIDDIKITDSPGWMQERLTQCGVNPINNVVDITNYVMLECGQPMHAFDKKLLRGERIIVRPAAEGEKMATLDGVDREISPDMLMIADARKPVAVAGVMGGAGSEICGDTTTVLLESAYFEPTQNRKTSKMLGLVTESSYRFERGVDIGKVEWASRRAAYLLAEHAGGTVAQGVLDVYPEEAEERRASCRFAKIRELMGVAISNRRIVEILESLELTIEEQDEDSFIVAVPSFRVDLECERDMVEEIARIEGLDKVPDDRPRAEIVPNIDDSALRAVFECRNRLVGLGLIEVMNYSLVSSEIIRKFGFDEGSIVPLLNPISASQDVLRPALLPQMIETLGRNRAHQAAEAGLFEIGRVFRMDKDGKSRESDHLAVGLMGNVGRAIIDKRREAAPEEVFLWMKGIIEKLCSSLRVSNCLSVQKERPYFRAGCAVSVEINGVECGEMGVISLELSEALRVTEPMVVLEMQVKHLLQSVYTVPQARPIPIYPSIVRDVAIVIDDAVQSEQVTELIRKNAPPELTDVNVFDIYRGKGIRDGKRSIAYSLTYQSLERTLTDAEANEFHESIVTSLLKELDAEIRDKK